MLTRYTVIPVEGEMRTYEVPLAADPGYDALREIVDPLLDKGQHLERVAVLYEDKPADMFVGDRSADPTGPGGELPVNPRATDIYYAWTRKNGGRMIEGDPQIHGVAVLFHRRVWF